MEEHTLLKLWPLRMVGVIPRLTFTRYKLLQNIHSGCYITCLVIALLCFIVKLSQCYSNLELFAEVLYYASTNNTMLVHTIVMLCKQQDLVGIVTALNVTFRQRSLSPQQASIQKRADMLTKVITRSVEIFMIFGGVVLVLVAPWICHRANCRKTPEESGFPLASWFPADSSNPTAYIAAYAFQVVVVYYWALLHMGTSILFASITLQLSAQFRMLGIQFSNIRDTLAAGRVTERRLQSSFVYNELTECIRWHHQLMSTFQNVQSLFAHWIFFITVASACGVAVHGCIFITSLEKNTPVLRAVVLIVIPLAGLSMICWCGQIVQDSSSNLHEAVYNSCWVGAPKRLQRAFMIILESTKKPLKLRAVFYIVNMESFSMTLHATYSYFNGMRTLQMKGKKK